MDISSRIPLIDETARNQDSAIAQAITAGFRGFLADDDYRKPTETVEDLTDAISLLHQYARDGNLPSLIDILNKHPEIVNAGDEAEKVTALHYAARYGRYKIVQVLLDRGADGNAINSEMMTPLHMAAKFCKTEATVSTAREEKTPRLKHTSRSLPEGTPEDTDEPPVKRVIYRLIKAGVMRDPMTLYNMTPLHYAAMKDNLAAAEALVEMGARINPDLNEPDSEKMVPALLTACTYGSDSVALFLLGKGADLAVVRPGDRSTAFHIAAFHGKDQTLASLLHKAGPRKHEFLQQSNADEMTPFCLAVEGGNPETAKLILQHIGSINPDGKEQWLLHTAAEKGNLDVVKVLIEAKADPKKEDRNKHLPIHLAAMGNHVAVIRYLVELDKTCVDAPDHQGMTPLLLAATSSRSSDAVKVLVEEFGADMGKRDNEGRSIVYVASKYSAIQSLEYILDKLEATCPILPRQMTLRNLDIACPGITLKTLIDLPDHSQMTPMHLVCGNGYLETVQILYSRGASLEKLNEDEETPLHLAARGGRTETVRTLLGWDKSLVGAKEEMGNTPLHLAAKCGRDQSVNLLLDAGADINSRNEKNETPLYLAASYGHDVVVRIFVERNVDMNVETESGSALHEAARRGHHDVVRTLIEKRNHKREPLVDVTKRWNGKTALQIAIEAGHRDTARVFVECQEWEALMTGQETLPLTGNNEPRQSAMRELIQHFPDVAIAVFENCIIHKCDGSDYNFTLLDDTYMLKNEEGLLQADIDVFMSAEEGGKLKPEAKTYSQNPDAIYQNHPLKLIAASERMSLLSHPLVLTLIKYKWNSLGRYVYYSALMIYLTFICLFTAFVILSPAPFNIYDENKNESLDLSEALRYSTFACPDIKIAPTGSLMALKVIIIILSVAQMCKEIFQMAHRRIAYMTLDNLIEWFIYVSVVMTVWDFCPCSESTGVRMTWQWILAAAAVFACWINLLLMIRKLPRFGIYVVMFFDIFRTFCRFFIIFVLFIIAFSVTFYVLLQNRPEFSTPMSAVLKTTVMMIGEFEFTAIFHGDPNEHVERLFGHGLAYPIFFVFCIVMTILLMNLLVGLAVGDIMQVQEKAELRRLCMQIDLVLQIEATMPWVREKTIRGRFRVFTIKNKTTWNKMLRFFGKKFGFESPIEEPTQVTRSEEEERILELREEQRAQRAQISQIQSNVDFMYQKQVEFESLLKSLLRHHNVPFVETAEQKQHVLGVKERIEVSGISIGRRYVYETEQLMNNLNKMLESDQPGGSYSE